MRTVFVTHDYDVDPQRLWRLVVDFDALSEVMAGLATFTGLPEGRLQEGQIINVDVSLFGKLPAQPYTMHVLECDDAAMRFRSSEHGSGVKSWQHELTITATATGCRLEERILVDAGWMTWAAAWWARYLYKARHKPRLELMQSGRF